MNPPIKTTAKYGLEFHHFGLAVKTPEAAIRFLSGLGYDIGPTYRDPEQNVFLFLCSHSGMPAVEVIYPTETPGPLAPILKSNASLIYHLCYESNDRDKSVRALEADNNRVFPMADPKPAVLFGGRKVSFYLVQGFGVIEILEPM